MAVHSSCVCSLGKWILIDCQCFFCSSTRSESDHSDIVIVVDSSTRVRMILKTIYCHSYRSWCEWQLSLKNNTQQKSGSTFLKWLTSSCREACHCPLVVAVCSESSCCGPPISFRCGKRCQESRSYWPGGCWGVKLAWARRTSASRPSNSDGRRRRWCTPEGNRL